MSGNPDYAGNALVHGIDILANGFGVSMGPGQTISFPAFEINRPGYLLNVEASFPGASGTNPLCSIDFGWYDSTQTVHFGHESWRIPAGTTGNGYFHTGRGPTKGQLLQLSFTNRDTVQSMESTFWLAQTTQHASRDDLRLHSGGISPVWTDASGQDPTFNRLANWNALVVPANTTQHYLLPLYSGQASIIWEATGQAAANVFSVQVIQADANLGIFSDDYFLNAGASPFISPPGVLMTLPRKVCLLVLANTGATPVTTFMSMVAQEYSS